jgi:hypothetical protein
MVVVIVCLFSQYKIAMKKKSVCVITSPRIHMNVHTLSPTILSALLCDILGKYRSFKVLIFATH